MPATPAASRTRGDTAEPGIVRLAAVLVVTAVHPAFAEEDRGYVESIAFEEVLPNEPGAWDVRATATARGDTVEASAHAFFGIVDRLGGEVEVPLVMHGGAAGLGDVGGSLTYLLVRPDGARPALSARATVHAPTGDADRMLGDGATEVEGALGFAFVLPTAVIQGNAGYETGAEDSVVANLSLAVALPHGLHVFGETTGELRVPDHATSIAAGPGLAYAIGPELFVAGCALFAVAGEEPARAIVEAQYGF